MSELCVERKTSKYKDRNSPPYKASECQGQKKKGNDGSMYKSVPHGKYYRWVKSKSQSPSPSPSTSITNKSKHDEIRDMLVKENYDSLIDIRRFLHDLIESKVIHYTKNKDALKVIELLSNMALTTEAKIKKIEAKINNLPKNVVDSVYDWLLDSDTSPLTRMRNEEDNPKYYDEDGDVIPKYKAKMEKIKISVDLYSDLAHHI